MTFHYAVTGVPAPTISKWSIKIGELKFQIERGCPAFHTIDILLKHTPQADSDDAAPLASMYAIP